MSMYENDIDYNALLSSTSFLPPDITLKLIPEGVKVGKNKGAKSKVETANAQKRKLDLCNGDDTPAKKKEKKKKVDTADEVSKGAKSKVAKGMEEDEDTEDEVVVKAHRMVLSLLSPFFRVHLSEGGLWAKSGREFLIKDVSPKPFKIMIEFFYKKDFKLADEFTSMEDLFEILKVADRFQVDKLVTLCKSALMVFPIQLNSLVDIVNTAQAYGTLDPCDALSKAIIKRASGCFANNLSWLSRSTTHDVFNSLAKSENLKSIVEKIEASKNMMESELNEECKKCGVLLFNNNKLTHENSECKVIHNNMVVGAKVAVTERSTFLYGSEEKLEAGHEGKVEYIWSGKKYDYDRYYCIKWDFEEVEGRGHMYCFSDDLHVPIKYIRG